MFILPILLEDFDPITSSPRFAMHKVTSLLLLTHLSAVSLYGCVSPTGWEQVRNSTTISNQRVKGIRVRCPAGKIPLTCGWSVTGVTGAEQAELQFYQYNGGTSLGPDCIIGIVENAGIDTSTTSKFAWQLNVEASCISASGPDVNP